MQTVTLRAIRLHHYNRAVNGRIDAKWHHDKAAKMNDSLERRHTLRHASMLDSSADWHMQAVRALDPLVTGTVEEDERRKYQGMEMLP